MMIVLSLHQTGDNMLTALSVARDCHIIEPCDKTILVQVVPPSESQAAHIQWNYAEEVGSDVKEIVTKRLQVRGLIRISIVVCSSALLNSSLKLHFIFGDWYRICTPLKL